MRETIQIQKQRGTASRLRVRLEPTIPMFEWAKTFHASDRKATLVGMGLQIDKIVPALNQLSTTPRRRMGVWLYRSTYSETRL
jgi:hypothetical protein